MRKSHKTKSIAMKKRLTIEEEKILLAEEEGKYLSKRKRCLNNSGKVDTRIWRPHSLRGEKRRRRNWGQAQKFQRGGKGMLVLNRKNPRLHPP